MAKTQVYNIIYYERKYFDSMSRCYIAAKDAVGRYAPQPQDEPVLNDDMLDIEKNYYGRNDVFYLAIDEYDNVIGMIGTHTVSSEDLWLKRFFVAPHLKGEGIGSQLLAVIEAYASDKNIANLYTRFVYWYKEAKLFYQAKGFVYDEEESDTYLIVMKKELKS